MMRLPKFVNKPDVSDHDLMCYWFEGDGWPTVHAKQIIEAVM
jgi:hypothetical protein